MDDMGTILERRPGRQMSLSSSLDFINVEKSTRTLVEDNSYDLLFIECSCSSILITLPSALFRRPSIWLRLIMNITVMPL